MTYTGTLTDDQIRATEELRDGWLATALSTDRCDRRATERAVHDVYRAAGHAPPLLTIWMDSPLGGVLAKAVLRGRLLEPDQVRIPNAPEVGGYELGEVRNPQLRDMHTVQLVNQPRDQLGHLLGHQLRQQLQDQVWLHLRQLRNRVGDRLGHQLEVKLRTALPYQTYDHSRTELRNQRRDRLGDELPDRIGNQLRNQLEDQYRNRLGDELWDLTMDENMGGAVSPWHDSCSAAALSRSLDIAGLPASPRLDALSTALRHAGWWWPLRDAVVITDRPTSLLRDQQGRLHSDTGPALTYADGYGAHWWHGTPVPSDLIEGNEWTLDRILQEGRPEVRLCAIEKRGWDRFIVETEQTRIGDIVPDPGVPGRQLALYDVPTGPYGTTVRVLLCDDGGTGGDGSRRWRAYMVPSGISDPIVAASGAYGGSRSEYAPPASSTQRTASRRRLKRRPRVT